MEELYVVTKKREIEIKSLGYKYVSIWEHEYQRQLKRDEEMKNFVNTLDVQDRLNPRDSFLEEEPMPCDYITRYDMKRRI